MATFAAVEKLALELPEGQRAALAMHMLHSLPAMFSEEDEGLVEAERRDAELEADPSLAFSLDMLDRKISDRRR